MPTLALYGRVFWRNNASGLRARDDFLALVQQQAPLRGFTAGPVPDWGYTEGGATPLAGTSGNPAVLLCYLHSDQAVVDQALADLVLAARQGGRGGTQDPDVFGSGYVSDLTPEEWVASLTAPRAENQA